MSSSGSDSGDEDYVPSEGEAPSEAESEGEEEDFCNKEEGEEKVVKGRKNTKKRKRNNSVQDDDEEPKAEEEKPGDIKKKSESLWSDFLKQVSPSEDAASSSEKPKSEQEKQVVTQVFEFAGEKVTVKKEVDSETEAKKTKVSVEAEKSEEEKEEVAKDAEENDEVKKFAARKSALGLSVNSHAISKPKMGGSILSSALDKLGKKNKLSTLEKSKLDWESYKDKEGINEEISSYNRGKMGFLEKRDFLERTDLKQYELEKQLRNSQRSKR